MAPGVLVAEKASQPEGTACAKALEQAGSLVRERTGVRLCGLNPEAGGERPQSGKDSGLYPQSHGKPLRSFMQGSDKTTCVS